MNISSNNSEAWDAAFALNSQQPTPLYSYDYMKTLSEEQQLQQQLQQLQQQQNSVTYSNRTPSLSNHSPHQLTAGNLTLNEQDLSNSHFMGISPETITGNDGNVPMVDCDEVEECIKKELEDGNNINNNYASNSSFQINNTNNTNTINNNNNNNKLTTRKSSSPSETSDSSFKNDQLLTEEELYQKRKAQNRAAQRAFRERKEGKLKELSVKLSQSESEKSKLLEQLDTLQKKNLMLGMQNKLLQKNDGSGTHLLSESSNNNNNNNTSTSINLTNSNDKFEFPKTKKDFITGIIDIEKHAIIPTEKNHDLFNIPNNAIELTLDSNNINTANTTPLYLNGVELESKKYAIENQEVLTVSALWDYLNELSLNNEDLDIDIPAIMEKLRGTETCHGYGPAYPLSSVNEVIKEHIL